MRESYSQKHDYTFLCHRECLRGVFMAKRYTKSTFTLPNFTLPLWLTVYIYTANKLNCFKFCILVMRCVPAGAA